MAVQRRSAKQGPADSKAAPASDPREKKSSRKTTKGATGAVQAPAALAGPASPLRLCLAIIVLAVGLASAISDWPIYMVYEKDIRRPAIAFTLNLSITAIISLLVSASPQVRALKKPSPAATTAAAAATTAAAAAASTSGSSSSGAAATPEEQREREERLKRAARRQSRRPIVAALSIIVLALYYGFGVTGPCGALTATCLSLSMFLVLP